MLLTVSDEMYCTRWARSAGRRVVLLVQHLERMDPADEKKPPDTCEPDWDVVDQASWESFPASDPPGWTPARATPCDDAPEEDQSHAHAPMPVTESPTVAPAIPAVAPPVAPVSDPSGTDRGRT